MKPEVSDFDSDWFGYRVGRASHPIADDWALENRIDCLCLLIPTQEISAIYWAEEKGARFVDVRVELACEAAPAPCGARPFVMADVDDLAAISRTAFRGLTRFYADPRFADSRCDDLYENWLRESCDGWAEEVLVAEGSTGFVTIHVDGSEASIGLIAVHEDARGKQLGSSLSRAAVHWAFQQGLETISVVTQGCNIPAQRAFQSAGFVTRKTEVWLHKWYG